MKQNQLHYKLPVMARMVGKRTLDRKIFKAENSSVSHHLPGEKRKFLNRANQTISCCKPFQGQPISRE